MIRLSSLLPSALFAAAALATGCVPSAPPDCSSAPDEAIESFQVTIGTGADATDADIYFCITRKSDAVRDCAELDNLGEDDFDEGSVEDYNVDLAVDAGDLDELWVENRGDAPGLSMDGNDWTLQSFRVVAITASGSTELVDAPEARTPVYEGDEYNPGCTY
jgi:hypothetical protein